MTGRAAQPVAIGHSSRTLLLLYRGVGSTAETARYRQQRQVNNTRERIVPSYSCVVSY